MSDLTEVSRKLVAVFAADVEGYSRLMGIDEVGTLKGLTERRAILDRFIGEHRGRIANTAGDSVLAEFGSAVDAVKCAVDAQTALAEANASLPSDRRINFRIGVHIGDVMVRAGDLYGEGVNIAARLQTIAKPGSVCISGATYDQVRKVLPIAFSDLGGQQVKNIEEPIRAYEAGGLNQAIGLEAKVAKKASPLPLPDKPSIAVLPFQNMSGDPEQEYFADGMVEEIITALSRNKQLFVIARNSSFTFKGKAADIKQVARVLGVRYVLEGSVRKSGNRIRIAGQLIDAASEAHLWADKFDGDLEEVFDLQDQVAASVSSAIGVSVTTAEMERAKRKPTDSLDAYDCFLRGQSAHWQFTKDSTNEAVGLYEQAISLDPSFVPAHAALAAACGLRRSSGWSDDPALDLSRSLACARHAIRLAPQDPLILARGAAQFTAAGELELADSLADQANRLDPNEMYALLWGGFAKLFLGNHRAASDRFQRVLRLSPVDPRAFYAQTGLAFAHFFQGDYGKGCEYAVEAVRDHPEVLVGLRGAMACHAFAGDVKAAHEFYRRLALLAPSERVSDLRSRNPYRREEDYKKLEQAYRLAGMPE
jgi:adenylate cyclase